MIEIRNSLNVILSYCLKPEDPGYNGIAKVFHAKRKLFNTKHATTNKLVSKVNFSFIHVSLFSHKGRYVRIFTFWHASGNLITKNEKTKFSFVTICHDVDFIVGKLKGIRQLNAIIM